MLQILTSSRKEQQLAQTQAHFDLDFFRSALLFWLDKRQTITHSDITRITGHMINEVDEVEAEVNASVVDSAKIGQEGIDVLWLATGIMIQHGVYLDQQTIKSQLDGLGRRSDFFDRTREVIGNLPVQEVRSGQFKKELEHLFVLLLSKLADLPVYLAPNQIIQLVLNKNIANYPAEAFSGRHPVTGKLLDREQHQLAYTHARNCLRTIRNYLTKELHWHDREFGLKREDWLPFLKHMVLADYGDAGVCARHVAAIQRGIKAKYPATVAAESPSLAVSQAAVDSFLLRQFNAALSKSKTGQERTVYAS